MSTLNQSCCQTFAAFRRAANMLPLTLTLVTIVLLAGQVASSQTFSLLHQFKAGPKGSGPYASLILDPQGNLYGTTFLGGGHAYGTVFKISPTGQETVLYSFKGAGGDGANPVSPLVRDADGNLYGTTLRGGIFTAPCGPFGCGIVFKLSPAGKETVLYKFTGAGGDGYTPWQGLVRDPAGNLYGTTYMGGAYGAGTVFKVDPAGTETVLYSFGANDSDGIYPLGGALIRDAAGNLYGTTTLSNSQSGTVFKLAQNGVETILHTFIFASGDGEFPEGTLLRDKAGNIYGITSTGGTFGLGTVFKLDANNTETVLYSFSGAGGDGAAPGGGLVLNHGNLYSTTNSGGDLFYGTVFKLDANGVETILHSFSGSDGNLPEFGLVQDAKGNLFGTTQYGGAHGGGVVFKIAP